MTATKKGSRWYSSVIYITKLEIVREKEKWFEYDNEELQRHLPHL